MLLHHQRKAPDERKVRIHVKYVSMLCLFGTMTSVTLAPHHIPSHPHFFWLTFMDAHSLMDSPHSWTGPIFMKSHLLLISVSPPHAFRWRCSLSLTICAVTRIQIRIHRLLDFGLSPDLHSCSWTRDDGLRIFCSSPGLEK